MGIYLQAKMRLGLLALALLYIGVASVVLGTEHREDEVLSLLDDQDPSDVLLRRDNDHRDLKDSDGASVRLNQEHEFTKFTRRHRKRYENRNEYLHRYKVWKDNLEFVRTWNSDHNNGFKVGMNEFADLTDDEFAEHYLNSELNDEAVANEATLAESALRSQSEELVQVGDREGW